jgi:hypothetical protein
VPSAPANFACCDRCATLGTARSTRSGATARVGGAGHLASADTGVTGVPVEAAPGCAPRGTAGIAADVLASHPVPVGADVPASPALVVRRRLLKAAVFHRVPDLGWSPPAHLDQATATPAQNLEPTGLAAVGTTAVVSQNAADSGDAEPAAHNGFADSSQLPRTVWGTVLDVSPHVLVVGDAQYQQRFSLTPDAVAWRGRQLEPAGLRLGDNVVVRLHPGHRAVADRIWANIGRVTGVIVERSGDALLVDEGAIRGPQLLVLNRQAVGRIMVRFPTLEPGFLVDIIGRRQGDELVGLIPATSQPNYPADRLPGAPLVNGRLPRVITGSATWHEPRDEAPGVLGVAYPALDPETGCAEDAVTGLRQGYARMPFVAIGSVLRVRNDCTGSDCLLPVTGCAPIARLFNDRCVTCGTSPRGRIADLTMASFIALGGELERGCFNAALTIGE